MNKTELLMRRRIVLEFIKADPVFVEVTRKAEPTRSPAGGWIQGDPRVLPQQRARIVLNKRRFNNGVVNAEAGDIPHTDYLLIGVHTIDIVEEDEFEWLGQTYHVTGIHHNRTESLLASIDLLGPDNRNG